MNDISIIGTGLWYPDELTTNKEVVDSYNTYVDNFNKENASLIESESIKAKAHSSEEFILKASGIKTRRLIDKKNSLDPTMMRPVTKNEDASELSLLARVGIEAAKKAMAKANINADQIDGVILGTSHSGRNYPAVAIEIQEELGIDGYAYDMLVGCSSTTFALSNAFTDIASGMAKTILVINPEISTPGFNFTNRDVHFIFGDGCVATILQQTNESGFKIIDRKLVTKFSNNIRSDLSYLNRTASNQKTPEELLFYQNGRSVFKEVCPLVAKTILEQLNKNNIKPDEISKFWLHQANGKMIRLIVSKVLGTDSFDEELAPLPMKDFGNLASAGSMFAFDLYNDLSKGEKGVICSFGAGYSIGSLIVEKN